MNCIKNYVKNHKGICITVGCIFFAMLLLNGFTPLITDDYTYSFVYTTPNRLHSMGDVFTSLYNHYRVWAGRSVIFFFLQMSLLIGKGFFNVLSAVCCVLLVVLMVKLAVGTTPLKTELLIVGALGVWFLMPAFGETMLWMTGACNYLWVTVVVLTFLLPVRYLLDDQDVLTGKKWWISWFLFAVIAGWCNETVSGVCVLFSLFVVVIRKWIQKKKNPGWMFIGLIGNALGLLLLLAAPGNANRTELLGGNSISLTSLEVRFTSAVQMIYDNTLILYIWFVVLFVLLIYMTVDKIQLILSVMLILCSLAGNFAMILSPYFPERAMFTGAVFALSACIYVTAGCMDFKAEMIDGQSSEHKLREKVLVSLLTAGLVVFAFQYYLTFVDIAHVYVAEHRRSEMIRTEAELGNLDIVVEEITKKTERNAWEDMKTKPEEWPNMDIAQYYELNSIRIE